MVGLERSVLPLVGKEDFGLSSKNAILLFVVAFGVAKALANLAAAALVTGVLAATFAPRTIVWVGAAMIAGVGIAIALVFIRDTGAHMLEEQRAHGQTGAGSLRSAFLRGSVADPVLRACAQAG